jgi:hypothetical protein
MITYNFREFMQGTHEFPKQKTQLLLYSSIIPLSLPYVLNKMFLNTGVLIVGSVGLLAIGLAFTENNFVKKGDSVRADRIAIWGGVIMRVIGYGSVIYFIGHLITKFPL